MTHTLYPLPIQEKPSSGDRLNPLADPGLELVSVAVDSTPSIRMMAIGKSIAVTNPSRRNIRTALATRSAKAMAFTPSKRVTGTAWWTRHWRWRWRSNGRTLGQNIAPNTEKTFTTSRHS